MDERAGLKAVLKVSIGHPLFSINPLKTKGRYGQARLKAVLKQSIGHPLLSISPLGTKGRVGQAGIKAVLLGVYPLFP